MSGSIATMTVVAASSGICHEIHNGRRALESGVNEGWMVKGFRTLGSGQPHMRKKAPLGVARRPVEGDFRSLLMCRHYPFDLSPRFARGYDRSPDRVAACLGGSIGRAMARGKLVSQKLPRPRRAVIRRKRISLGAGTRD
jgi:hypothetical protein